MNNTVIVAVPLMRNNDANLQIISSSIPISGAEQTA
jgi:hypothetical protein